MTVNNFSKDIKRHEEVEFLKRIKDLEEQETTRRLTGVKAINEDFKYYNEKIQRENQMKKVEAERIRQADSYNHFPFVSGEVIEKHRAQLGAQLKNDLQSYLDFQSKKTRFPKMASTSYDSPSVVDSMNFSGGQSLLSSKRRQMKQLFDSDYVRPEENYRVKQDSDPYKKAALTGALKRYEDDLKKQKSVFDVHERDHYKKIDGDQLALQAEKDEKMNKQ